MEVKTMKKFLALLLAMVMVLALAACGGGGDTPAPARIFLQLFAVAGFANNKLNKIQCNCFANAYLLKVCRRRFRLRRLFRLFVLCLCYHLSVPGHRKNRWRSKQ